MCCDQTVKRGEEGAAGPDPEPSDEQTSGICVFEKGEGCGGGEGWRPRVTTTRPGSHHSCGVFMSDGPLGWLGFRPCNRWTFSPRSLANVS